ncbi:MAG TPA: sulfite exporter TauE/SafE family protein [Candidatus Angelobacter sp.]|nr:sulfite exporter TauE/SafE family protein [Candidatus Angelobacter sp.]
MNWWAIFGAGLLAGATTCAVAQGGLLVGLINRQKKAGDAARLVTAGATAPGTAPGGRRRRRAGGRTGAGSTTSRTASTSATEDLIPVAGFLFGKLVVLTLAGLVLGAFGSFIALDARIGGVAQLVAAAIMIVFGLGAAGVRGFADIRFTPPDSWTRVVRRSTRSQSAFAPFLLGVAVILIPCGVTISMMLLAATAGSAAEGGAVMAVFVLGTAPMFAAYGFLTQRYVNPDSRRMSIALGAVVVLMGLVTLNASLTALASPITAQSIAASVLGSPAAAAPPAPAPALVNGAQVLRIDATSGGYSPSSVAARAGIPTKVVFHTDNTRSCIVYTVFPSIGKQVVLPDSGDTEVDLGTLAAGEIPISCSMGMYTGTIVVS